MTYNQLRNYIIGTLGLVGVVSLTLYTGGLNRQEKTIDPITVDGRTITFTCTDKIQGEDLIIMTDRCEYKEGFSSADVYVAVANISGKKQDVELMAYFRTDGTKGKRIREVSVLGQVTQEFNDPVFEERCDNSGSSTVCSQVQTGTTTRQVTKNIWGPLPTTKRDVVEVAKELGYLEGKTRERISTYFAAADKSIAFPVANNEVIYYKVHIEMPPNERNEFFFEAVGSLGGYGFMK